MNQLFCDLPWFSSRLSSFFPPFLPRVTEYKRCNRQPSISTSNAKAGWIQKEMISAQVKSKTSVPCPPAPSHTTTPTPPETRKGLL